MKRLAERLTLILAGTVVAVILVELLLRALLEPIDYLAPITVFDPVLTHRALPFSGGHDAWGFRNRCVPEAADIVAIGDSQTYGAQAVFQESWPAWLERMSGERVYNLALGGYGPLQYLYLLETRGLSLRPWLVIVGFYLGNDLTGAFRSVYGLEHWSYLRDYSRLGEFEHASQGRVKLNAEVIDRAQDRDLPFCWLRQKLRSRSMIYRLLSVATAEQLRKKRLLRRADDDPGVVVLRHGEPELFTALQPRYTMQALDLDDPRVVEGLRLSLDTLELMHRKCVERGVAMLVVILPTKVSVTASLMRELGVTKQRAAVERQVTCEAIVRERTKSRLAELGIPAVDPLPALEEAVRSEQIYPRSLDGHPNGQGYRVISEVVERAVANLRSRTQDGTGETSTIEMHP